jgi:hypothetical protein
MDMELGAIFPLPHIFPFRKLIRIRATDTIKQYKQSRKSHPLNNWPFSNIMSNLKPSFPLSSHFA